MDEKRKAQHPSVRARLMGAADKAAADIIAQHTDNSLTDEAMEHGFQLIEEGYLPNLDSDCRRCGGPINPAQVLNALSRRDNKTYICSPCGMSEAFEDFIVAGDWEQHGVRTARQAWVRPTNAMLIEQMIIERGMDYDVDPEGQIIIFTSYADRGDDQQHDFVPIMDTTPFEDWVGGIHEALGLED
tara:strand:+ start:4859 stop:5416 length:558 start_codon:yes stop_codon:yes gene_type:complete